MNSAIPRNYIEFLENMNKSYRDKNAIFEKSGNGFIGKTFGNLYDDVQTFSKKLYTLGMQGKKIAIMGESCYNWLVAYYSVVAYVGVAIPIDEEWTAYEFENILNTVDIDCVICDEKVLDKVYPVCLSKGIQTIEFKRDLEIILSEKLSVSHIELDYDKAEGEMSVLAFTSGTSGNPKGVMLSQTNLVANQAAARETVPYSNDERILLTLPFCHILTVNVYVSYYLNEGCSIYISKIESILEDLKIVRPTCLPATPYLLEKIIRSLDEKTMKKMQKDIESSNALRKKGKDKRLKIFKDFHSIFGGKLVYITLGGTLVKEAILKFYENTGMVVLQGYGLTECAPIISTNTFNNNMLGTVGKVLYGQQVKIVNSEDSKTGEILVKGKNVMLGYYNNQALNEKVFTADGYFKTGDLGYFDNTGCLHLVGRKKRLVTTSTGKNIYLKEIENMFISNPAISRAVVFYEKMYLNVTLVTNLDQTEIENIISEVNKRLPKYKRIKNYDVKREKI